MSDDVEVKFGANIGDAVNGISQLLTSIKGLSEEAKGHIEGMASTFGKLQEAMLGIAAIVAGGAMFKEMINASVEAASQVTGLQKAFGMTLAEANQTKSSLDLLGLSTDSYTQMAQRLDRQLRTGNDALTKMGLTAKDLDLGQKGVMDKAIAKLAEYKEGVDRNIAAQVLFGRGGADAIKMVRLNLETVTDKAKELEEALGLTVTAQDQTNARQYKLVLNELGMAFEGIKKTIGDAVLPYLTKFGDWFVSVAPLIIKAMKDNMTAIVEGGFAAAEGFINFVVAVVNGVYELYNAWQNMKWLFGGEKNNEGLASFRSALDGLDTFRTKAIATITDIKAAVMANKPFEGLDLGGVGKGTKSAAGLMGGQGDGAAAAAKDIEAEIKVLQTGLQEKKSLLDAEVATYKITQDQKFQSLRDYTDDAYNDEKALLEKEMALYSSGTTQYAAVKAKLLELDAKYALESQKITTDQLKEQQKSWDQFSNAIQGAFNSQLKGLLSGTTSWSQAFKNILGDLVIKFIEAVEKMALDWVGGQNLMTVATVTGNAARTASDVAGAAASAAAGAANVVKSIMSSAAETFAGVFGFLSPAMGPAAAGPAAASEALVAAQAGAVASYDVGTPWVPSDGLAMLHRGEAVIPASVNAGGLGNDSGGGAVTHNWNIQALDGQSVARFFKSNAGVVNKFLSANSKLSTA